MTKPTEKRSETMFSAFVRDRAETMVGSLHGYAELLGINHATVWRWANGERKPSKRLMDKLAEETDKSPDALRRLSTITVDEACELLLNDKHEDNPADRKLQDRFTGLVRERGGSIPVAAYAVFITGDMTSRAALVDILEQHPDGIPEAFTPETLQFALDLPNSGLLPGQD